MEEQLITLETAKLAKEKGFDCETYMSYMEMLEHTFEDRRKHKEVTVEYIPPRPLPTSHEDRYLKVVCYAPTQSLLQKWLRKEHDIHVELSLQFVIGGENEGYTVSISYDNPVKFIPHWGVHKDISRFDSYEQALEKGLQEALKLIE